MYHVESDYVQTEQGQRDKEQIEEAIVAFAHTIGHPRTMVIEFLHAIVAHAAMRRTRWSINLTL